MPMERLHIQRPIHEPRSSHASHSGDASSSTSIQVSRPRMRRGFLPQGQTERPSIRNASGSTLRIQAGVIKCPDDPKREEQWKVPDNWQVRRPSPLRFFHSCIPLPEVVVSLRPLEAHGAIRIYCVANVEPGVCIGSFVSGGRMD